MNVFLCFACTLCLVCGKAWAENENCETHLKKAIEIPAGDYSAITDQIDQFFSDKKVVAILGSSRVRDDSPFYSLTRRLARTLGEAGYTILTGGGPGIMDAANKGAKETKANSIGFEVNTPWPRHSTVQIDRLFIFDDLQIRKKTFISVSGAFVFMPGGLGSLDELFTIVGAIYSGQFAKKPLILVGKSFWEPLMDFLKNTLVNEYQTAKLSDFQFIQVVDSDAEVFEILKH